MKKWLVVLICLMIVGHSAYAFVDFYLNPEADLTQYKRIAVIGFNDAPSAPGSGNVVADLIASELMKKGYGVVERSRIEMILNEQKLRISGIVDTSTAIQIGDYIIWMNAGAYHIPWETRFSNGFAKVIWYEDNQYYQIREAESFEKWWHHWKIKKTNKVFI